MAASTGMVDVKSVGTTYGQAFGNFPDQWAYSPGMNRQYQINAKSVNPVDVEKHGDGWRGVFQESRKAQTKALTTTDGSGGATTQALIPVFIDPRIVDISRKETPLTELVPRVSNQGIVAAYVRVTAKGAATTAAEDGPLTESNSTRVQENKTIKYLYAVGRVTGPAEQAIPAFTLGGFTPTGSGLGGSPFADEAAPNAMQQEVMLQARALKELEENLIINGNSTTSAGPGPNGTEFDGIVTQQGTTNKNDMNGDDMTRDDVEKRKGVTFPNGILQWIWAEEVNETTEHKINQLDIRLRGLSKIPKIFYMSFNPIDESSIIDATTWINNYIFEYTKGKGIPLTDFDEETPRFTTAILSMKDIMTENVDFKKLNSFFDGADFRRQPEGVRLEPAISPAGGRLFFAGRHRHRRRPAGQHLPHPARHQAFPSRHDSGGIGRATATRTLRRPPFLKFPGKLEQTF